MTEVHVSLDGDDLNAVARRLQEPLEAQLTSALELAANRVAEQYDGQSEDEVAAWILRETREGLHPDIAAGFEPDPEQLRRVARAVMRGERLA
ncbi:hypothetical protein [Catellatospora chokoriensis]|uniref:Uncharacterized protein n=1 Tax=Catellatospora chokoriensis TaxID=310353 RepID=A0A8J3K5U3_9ACTN|nr:hypothetical protein [Catellatospora chokoriensis]GIF91260.1 hypothetical protein Cch02nite_47040 [Catellatospora chokoriensis]